MEKRILFTANLSSFFIKFLIPQLKWFKDNGYEVHIAAKMENFEIPYCDKVFDVDFARGFNLKQNITSYKQMVEIFKNNQYDIVSCHTPFGGAITRLAAKKVKPQNTRMVYMAHGFHFYKGAPKHKYWLFYTAEKWLAKYTDEIITINLEDYEVAKADFDTTVSYVEGVGLDKAKFEFPFDDAEKDELKRSLGITDGDFVMIYPAELLPRKRQEWLINTLAPLMQENPAFKLLLPGKDSMNGFCQALAKKHGLEEKIHFLGFRRDIPKLIKISDIAVSSSNQEGLPVNVMEAIYVGLPIVATACRGNADLIDNGKNGYIVDINDSKGFCENVMKVYNMTQSQREEIKEYDKTVIKQYLLENVIEKIVNIYLNK
ncbi:MAG: glycosyltransferase [Clostridia bacterium]|nr:glycosyltransferase [Clostridia bacterium]